MGAFDIVGIPSLPPKPRGAALTSVLDKGLGPAQVRDLAAVAGEWIDVAKLGWGTARLHSEPVLREKLAAYGMAGIVPCTGGTLLEIAHAQGRAEAFLDSARELGFTLVEISDGASPLSPAEKARLIGAARRRDLRAWSEVGRKDPEEDARLTVEDRIDAIERDLAAGAERVVLEARESGTLGIYDRAGRPVEELLARIVERVGIERLVFEAPRKDQQVWMIRTFGAGVNLGNVAPDEALAVATLRLGLRADTFADVHLAGVPVHVETGVTGALAARRRGGVVILVDALRASATIVTALGRGIAAVRPVSTPDECVGDVTAGERGGRKLPNVRHGNSPTELAREDYRGRTLVLTTTNGVECLLTAAGPASTMLVGTTLNRRAVADAAVRLAQRDGVPITLLLAGRNNREAVEDSLAAGEILRAMRGVRLHGDALPSSPAIEAAFFESEAGRNLVALGYVEDVRACAQVDTFDVVPIVRDGCLVPLATRG